MPDKSTFDKKRKQVESAAIEALFYQLDLNREGVLSRAELHQAAQGSGWYRHHAPLYAVLDLLTLRAPLSASTFKSYLEQIFRDADSP